MQDLKMQHLIVMVALLVSLVGTLLIIGKMNTEAASITGSTAIGEEGGNNQHEETAPQEYEAVVRVVESNQTEEE